MECTRLLFVMQQGTRSRRGDFEKKKGLRPFKKKKRKKEKGKPYPVLHKAQSDQANSEQDDQSSSP